MAHSLFKKDIEPQCSICEHGTAAANGTVLCKKAGGVMQPYSKCKKFRYDPLKRQPKVAKTSFDGEFTKEDFSL